MASFRFSGTLTGIAVALAVVSAIPAVAATAGQQHGRQSDRSRITSVTVSSTQPVGTFHGAAYVRLVGTVTGVVDPHERIVGLADLPKDSAGAYDYSAQFELITAAHGQPRSDGILVEAENRGNPFLLDSLQNFAGLLSGAPNVIQYPAGLGNGFLQDDGLSWARVQWQGPNGTNPPVNATVPANAQGVGEVILRDFGLLLRGADGHVGAAAGLPSFDKLLLGSDSQSAWFTDAFIAEGFNANPSSGPKRVFDGAYTQDGDGNWLGINQINQARGFTTQTSYVEQNGLPLTPAQLLHSPSTDPFLVDVTAYTDFYRVRASVFNTARTPGNLREYNIPAAHVPSIAVPAGITVNQLGCAINGTPIPALNPVDSRPFARDAIMGLARQVGVRGLRGFAPALPPSTRFVLRNGPAAPDLDRGDPALPLFNFLPGVGLRVPVVDADNQPLGGVTFPDVRLSLGAPGPVAVPPVATRSIADTCGNFGGWQPFTAARLTTRYGSADRYVAAYNRLLTPLIARGYVLPADRAGILAYVRGVYDSAPQRLVSSAGDGPHSLAKRPILGRSQPSTP
ncbi:MAG TPA: alpha/beta hydrolase domain-containing protein [Pseudonocardiaceae bacterium]|nr:alpha/beta hydrolase domain-containing protein [Pseudonocardiaceae bacterium]